MKCFPVYDVLRTAIDLRGPVWLEVKEDLSAHTVLVCHRCGKVERIDPVELRAAGTDAILDRLEYLLWRHGHTRLSPIEREVVRVRMLHQRGARRLHS